MYQVEIYRESTKPSAVQGRGRRFVPKSQFRLLKLNCDFNLRTGDYLWP